MKSKLLSILILVVLLLNTTVITYSESTLPLVAESGIVINAQTGQVLYGKSPHQPLYPASTTKVLTAIIILEDLKLDDIVTVDDEATRAGGSHIALQPGEKITVRDLLYALMIASANDAAVALAKFHSGTIEEFANVMNERAKSMGAINSNFENPNGMPNEKHLTTAYDLAMIAKHAMTNPDFKTIVTTKRHQINPTNKQSEPRYLNSTNALFQGMIGSDKSIEVNGEKTVTAYEYADGIKRGYTDDAQYCFVGSATKEDRKLITVVLKSTDVAMYQDTRVLMDYGFNRTTPLFIHKQTDVVKKIAMQNKKGTVVNGILESNIVLDLPEGATKENVKEQITLIDMLELPINQGEVIGTIHYYYGDQMVLQTNIIADHDYIGDILLDKNIIKLNAERFFLLQPAFWLNLLIHLAIAMVLWRIIITALRIVDLRRRRRLKH